MSLDNFAFVLFKPKSPGNIGAAARALKNMGLRDLRIVTDKRSLKPIIGDLQEPRPGNRQSSAETMAVHGRDVLAAATIHADLNSALADRTLAVGTSARTGLYRGEAKPIRATSAELAALSEANQIALVFGPEDCGLTNEELKWCQRLIKIPTAPDYSSLNLAQAVMIVAYELMSAMSATPKLPSAQEWAACTQVNAMLVRMGTALTRIGFLAEDNPDHIMFALRAILGRAGLRPRELDIMNGIVSQILWFADGGHEILERKRRAGKKFR
jgi:tRNA/rRNA methyltransferase